MTNSSKNYKLSSKYSTLFSKTKSSSSFHKHQRQKFFPLWKLLLPSAPLSTWSVFRNTKSLYDKLEYFLVFLQYVIHHVHKIRCEEEFCFQKLHVLLVQNILHHKKIQTRWKKSKMGIKELCSRRPWVCNEKLRSFNSLRANKM